MKLTVYFAAVALLALGAGAQTAARVIGEVTSVDAASHRLVLKTDSGSEVTASLGEGTVFLRVPPGEKDLTKATKIALGDVQTGDRVLARGRTLEDQSIAAASIIVMSKSDLAQKAERDRAEWQRRGIMGVVIGINANEIAIHQRAGADTVIETSPKTRFRRYAPDSVRFADAKPGALADIKAGDQVRALGDASGEGRYKAEEVVSGTFRTIAATVTAVDPQANTVRITDLSTRKPLTVAVNQDSALRRIPPQFAERLAQFQHGAAGSGGRPPASGTTPGGRRMGPPDLGQMLERLPVLKLSELKPGEAVIVSSTSGSDSARATAIALVAGVEPLLSSGSQPLGGWNVDMGMGLP